MHRIAVLFEYPTLLGGERSLLASIERLRDRFEFVAIAPHEGDLAQAIRTLGITLIPSPLTDGRGVRLERSRAASRLIDLVRSSAMDLLHANSLTMGRLTGCVASQLTISCTAHLRDIIGLSATAIADLNRNARLFAVSAATRAFLVAQGIDAERTVVVHTGVDLTRFRPRDQRVEVRWNLKIPDNASVLLTVGQIGLRKGWDVLAEAVASLAHRWPNLHVVLVGERFASKAETVEYERRVREMLSAAIPGRVHFLGTRDDVPDLMAAADVLVHPARQEPFGRVLLEAAASGLAIVATDVGGTREMLDDGISARLVQAGDISGLAHAIDTLLENPVERRTLGVAARERVEQSFSAELAAKTLATEWGQVL